jgi:hypothetical protein
VVVQETEYTGAGKHPFAQLNLAKRMGVEVVRGDPKENIPGRKIVIPEHPSQIAAAEMDLDHVRRSYLRNALAGLAGGERLDIIDLEFLAAETRTTTSYVEEVLDGMRRTGG